MRRIIRNILILIAGGLLFNKYVLLVIGLANKHLSFIQSVFVAYPADQGYSGSYFFESLTLRVKWSPFPVGVARQNGKWTLICVISASERDIESVDGIEDVARLRERTDELRRLLHAPYMTFSGILPGVMYGKRIRREMPEADVTVDAVTKAVQDVKSREGIHNDAPVIVLGGLGFIGKRLMKKLGGNLRCVDLGSGMDWPEDLHGRRGVVVNVSRNTVLSQYVERLWPGLVLVNEVYPEPGCDEVGILNDKGVPAYHVVGAKAFSLPPFPGAYKGGIPCCAAVASDEMEVLFRRL